MTCIHCRGILARGSAPFSADRNGVHVHWESVPAWVCQQCGEPVFDEATVDGILRALTSLDGGVVRGLEATIRAC